ncbi:hypothetical protein CNR22_11450 [Sphingobacteriaceae bacterium]|nr:hypothetical protein CNR22_11450 [Sphingobacteriaceae bacterium]
MKRITGIGLLFLLIVFCVLMIRLTLPYFSMRYDVDFLLTKQKIIHLKVWRYAFYLHIFLSIFALIAGFTQFSVYVLKKHKRLHRLMGYIYVTDVLLLAGPAGLVMSFFANGTALAKTSFVLLSVLWILFTTIALIKVKRQEFKAHQNWMIRSYALTLSAISLRLYAVLFPKFFHINAFDQYALMAWLSWTINLLIAEYIIYKKRNGQGLFSAAVISAGVWVSFTLFSLVIL